MIAVAIITMPSVHALRSASWGVYRETIDSKLPPN